MTRACLLCALAAMPLHAGGPGVVAIRNATIHPASGPVVERGSVLIRDGLIEGAGTNLAVPPEAWVIEGAGLHVYPGLIDALSHWGMPAPERPAAAAPQSAGPVARGPQDRPLNSAWVHAQDLVRPAEKVIEEARSAGFTTAVVFPREGIFAGQGAALNLAGEKAGSMVVAAPAAMYLRFQTGSSESFPGSLMGVIAYGDPLETGTEVRHVFIGGRAASVETRHTRLYEKYMGRR